jgi:capsular exopolysaccharide synthesis family protein
MERRWLVLVTFFMFLLLSVFYLYRTPKVYLGKATIRIDREADKIMSVSEVFTLGGQDQDYLQTQYKLLQSRRVIGAVITNLHLEQNLRYARAKDIYKAVLADVVIVPIRLSRLVDVTAYHTDPEMAAKIANSVAEVYIQQNLNERLEKTLDAVRQLKAQIEFLRKDAQTSDEALQTFKEKYNVVSLEDDKKNNIDSTALNNAADALSRARAEADNDISFWEEVKKKVETLHSPKDEIPEIALSQVVVDIKKTINEQTASWASLTNRYKGRHPDLKAAKDSITALQARLESECDKIYEGMQLKADRSKKALEAAQKSLEEQQQKSLAMQRKRVDMAILQRTAESSKLLYDSVVSRMKETEVAEKIKSNNLFLVDPAVVPIRPARPNVLLVLVFGFLGGIAAAISLAFVANYLDNAVKGQDDVEGYLGLTFLGYVPHIAANNPVERDLEAHLHPSSSSSEGFRTIRAAVSLTNVQDKLHSIAVASTAPSEGKSLVASNFAIVTAQAGMRTLLVEADLRRPSVHKTFQLHSPVGMAAYLQGRVTNIQEIVHKTEIKNLDAICCGAIPSNPSELIGSERMSEFIREAVKLYDRVVLDCPPISAVSDPLIVAAKADGLIFVSKFNKIRREYAQKTVRRVQDAGIHILGAVINNIDFEGRDSYYYSQYYYQNRYYSSHYKSKPESGKEEAASTTSAKK